MAGDEKMLDVDFGAEKDMELELTEPAAARKRMSLVVPPSPIAKDIEKDGEEPRKPPPIAVPPPKMTDTVAVVPKKPKIFPTLISRTESPRPMTSSSKRLSWNSISTSKRRPIKYGTGKNFAVELVPQPSDDPEDPLVGSANSAVRRPHLNILLTHLSELADLEERTQLLCAPDDSSVSGCDEDRFYQCQQQFGSELLRVLYSRGRLDRRSIDRFRLHWPSELDRSKDMGSKTSVSGFHGTDVRWLDVEHACCN